MSHPPPTDLECLNGFRLSREYSSTKEEVVLNADVVAAADEVDDDVPLNDVSEDREVVDAFTDDSDEVKVAAGVLDAVPDDDDIVVLLLMVVADDEEVCLDVVVAALLRTDCCKSCS